MATITTYEERGLSPIDTLSNDVQAEAFVVEMEGYVRDLIVQDEGSYNELTSMYSKAREWLKKLETRRKDVGEPLRKQIAMINDRFKRFTDPLERLITISNQKASSYRVLLEQRKREEEAKINEAAKLFEVEEPIYVAPLDKTIRGDGAMTTTKVVKKFRVKDLSLVPSKYLKLDEEAVETAIKMGIVEIAGLEVYETTLTTLKTR